MLIRNHWNGSSHRSELGLLAWPVPGIGTFVHDPPAFLGATLPTRMKLSFTSKWSAPLEIFEILMAALPLDDILTLAAVDLDLSDSLDPGSPPLDVTMQRSWLSLIPNCPLLRRVHLAPVALRGFIMALLEDCKNPLLPSLTELALAETTLDENQTLSLRDALMKRVEQGVPLEILDLRMCFRDPYNLIAVQILSETAVDILRPFDYLGPEDTDESRDAGHFFFAKMLTMWEPFVPHAFYSGDDDSEDGEDEDEDDSGDDDDEDDGEDDDDEDDDDEDDYDYEDDDDDDDYVDNDN